MADTWNFPNFTRAVVRELSDGVTDSSYTGGRASKEPLDVAKCKSEWGILVQTLRDLGLDVTVLPQDPTRPDCLFVDDPCVVIGDTALITRPVDETRQGETGIMEETMRNLGLKVHVIESDTATMEGGDVIFTGKEIFCGDSVSTNEEGFAILKETFPDYPCHSVFVEYPEFHLKGFLAVAAPGVMAVCDNTWGRPAWEDVCKASNYTYQPLWVPDEIGCNCIYVNGSILHVTEKQMPDTYAVFQEKMADYNLIPMSTEEVSKLEGALTSQCLLF